jgi:predicted RNase H-like HicB family nuclease
MTYVVELSRDESGAWISDVPAVPGCHTYGRSIHEAIARTREALALWVEDADDAELVPDIKIAADLRAAARSGIRARTKADAAQAAARQAVAEAAQRLTNAGLSRRDVATLLGVSHQRIQQLLDRP